jgi:hypothetical protein
MRDGKIVEFFDTARDAFLAGQKLFEEDKLFSVQEVVETPVDLEAIPKPTFRPDFSATFGGISSKGNLTMSFDGHFTFCL